jgi:hypothetical protein
LAKRKGKGGLVVSSLAAHKKKGKLLQPPMNQIGGLQLSSWVNEVLPEMLWAALMLDGFARQECFDKFRILLDYVGSHPEAFEKKLLDLSGLADIDQNTFNEMFKPLCSEEAVRQALAPMMIFESLPGKERWSALIGAPDNNDEAVSTLVDCCCLGVRPSICCGNRLSMVSDNDGERERQAALCRTSQGDVRECCRLS